mgnify:FL=1
MLFTTVLSGPTLGAADTFTQGVDFNCNSAICYGIGAANHQLLKDLQSTINRYAPRGGFTPLTVDGFIGTVTVAAARIAANLIGASSGSTKEAVTANAPSLLNKLAAALLPSAPGLPAVAPTSPSAFPTAPAPRTGAITPSNAQIVAQQVAVQQAAAQQQAAIQQQAAANPLAPQQPPKAKVPVWVWIAAGVAGVIVVGAVGYVLRKPEPEPAGYADYYGFGDFGYGYALPRYPRRRRHRRSW